MRGLEKRHEQDSQKLIRDTRTFGQRVSDFFKSGVNAAIALTGLAAGAFFYPVLADLCLLLGVLAFIYTYTRKATLPFRLPQRSNLLDYNDLKPGTNKPNKARGICFFGNDLKTNEELWFSNDDMRTHVLIFGSTGSGKTEALMSLAYNALLQGSGFIYVDGKADNSVYAKIFAMVRSMGREDDLLLINFMTGAKDIVGPQEKRISNTMNPFSNGSSSMLSQLVVSMMDSSSASGDGDMWKGRAIAFVEALLRILVYMRDKGHILLDANTVRNYFELPKVETITMDKQFPRENQEPISLLDVPLTVLEPLINYMINLPGYDRAKKGKQVSQVWEQHGFITMQLTRVFTSLADTYGHILRTNLAEVDLRDVVLNRRILVVLLPALEKSPDELSNLGKVIIASLKAMMAAGLGESVEGSYRDIVQKKPTNAPTPFMCILDEYGYYAVKGFAIVPAQARSLGFCAVFAGQDLPAFQKASKEEAASIGANTNIKICMKLEDPTETWEFFTKTAGESFVTKVDAFQTKPDSIMNNYLDTRSASSEKRARIDLLDLKEQRPGEAHIFFNSTLIRARMFHANPPQIEHLRLNHFLKVEPPDMRELVELEQRIGRFQRVVQTNNYFTQTRIDKNDIETVASALSENEILSPIERGLAALVAFHTQTAAAEEASTPVMELIQIPEGEINIFANLAMPQKMQELIVNRDLTRFTKPLLDQLKTREQIQFMERLAGKLDATAANIAGEIVKDICTATQYPPTMTNTASPTELSATIDTLIGHFKAARNGETAGATGTTETTKE
jgi:intracellular multiplication protein IcmO